MKREFYTSDEDLSEAVHRLNGLFDVYRPFQTTRARKDHIDIFGIPIEEGETYYRRQCGEWFGSEITLSAASMEKVCGAILFNNSWLMESIVKKQQQEESQSSSQYLRLPSDGEKVD
jgi:hypothetical protein